MISALSSCLIVQKALGKPGHTIRSLLKKNMQFPLTAFQSCRRDAPLAAVAPEYCSAAWAVREIIDLTRNLVTSLGDQKRSYIQSLWLLASHPSANLIDPSVLLSILSSVEAWVPDPRIAQGMLQHHCLQTEPDRAREAATGVSNTSLRCHGRWPRLAKLPHKKWSINMQHQ